MRKRTFDSRLAMLLIVWVASFALAGVASAQKRVSGAAGSNDIEHIEPILIEDTYVYSVKMLCGTVFSEASFRQFPNTAADPLLVPGTYLTALNFHNPGGDPIEVNSSVVVPSGPGAISVTGIIPANAMGRSDCTGFLGNLDPSKTPAQRRQQLQTSFVEGYAVLRSPVEVAVTAVYTFKNVEAPSYILLDEPVEPPR